MDVAAPDIPPDTRDITGSLVHLRMLEGDDPIAWGRGQLTREGDHVVVGWGDHGLVLGRDWGDTWLVLWGSGRITLTHSCELESAWS